MKTLETERLILTKWSARKDAKDLFEYAKNPNVGVIIVSEETGLMSVAQGDSIKEVDDAELLYIINQTIH